MQNMKQTVLILIIFLFISGCKKNPYNYAKKIIGKYDFTLNVSTFVPMTGAKDTAYYFIDNIKAGEDKNSIIIPTPIFSIEAIIYEEGSLKGHWNNSGSGEFTTKNEFIYKWGTQSPGSSAKYQLKGVKK